MGARKKPEEAKMNIQLGVQVTKAKKDEYMKAAEEEKVTYSDWVRDALEVKLNNKENK